MIFPSDVAKEMQKLIDLFLDDELNHLYQSEKKH
jgi:hypothetical protein